VSRENCGCNSRAARDLSDRQHHGDSYRPNRSLFKDTRTNDHSYRLATTSLYTATECSVLSIVGWTSDSAHRNIGRNSAKYLLRPKCLYVSAAVCSRSAFSLRCFCDLHSLPVWTIRIVIHFSCSILQQSSCVFFRILWHKTWINKYAKSSVELEKVP